jgi:G:T/U-mismatch repair DNA glycosylase
MPVHSLKFGQSANRMWRILSTLFLADYEKIEFTILAPSKEVAPNRTQSELLSASA